MSIATYYSSFALESMKKKQNETQKTSASSTEDKPKRGRKKNDVHTDTSN